MYAELLQIEQQAIYIFRREERYIRGTSIRVFMRVPFEFVGSIKLWAMNTSFNLSKSSPIIRSIFMASDEATGVGRASSVSSGTAGAMYE